MHAIRSHHARDVISFYIRNDFWRTNKKRTRLCRMARKPKVAAPPGYRGCPKCSTVLPLVDPDTQAANFAANGYCKPCEKARTAAARAALAPLEAPREGPATKATRAEAMAQAVAAARIPPFPGLASLSRPQCACCHRAPTMQVHAQPFCDRCGYYVAACGRCVDHSFREFIPELRGNPDPPTLPYVKPTPLPFAGRTSGVRGRDETDLTPEERQ
jgi:hypothetical protein